MFKNRSPRFIISVGVTLVLTFFAWRFLIQKASPVVLKGSRVPHAVALPDISLKSTDKVTRLSDYKGKWLLLFFGFTHCPDVCPTSLAYLKTEYHALQELRPYVKVGFISVDTERDDPESCATFVKTFEPEFSCLIADEPSLKLLSKQLGSYANKDGSGKDYNVVHSGDIYLVSPEGEWTAFYRPPFEPGLLQHDVQKLIQRYSL